MSDRTRWGERVYRALLRLYPEDFRTEYAARLVDAFRAQRAEPRYRAPLVGPLRFWIEVLWDLGVSAARIRLDRGGRRRGVELNTSTANGRAGGDGTMTTMGYDLKTAVRALRRSPGFTAVAVLTLGLGIGAATAIFAVVNGTILRPLPYGQPDDVVTVWSRWTDYPDGTWVSRDEYRYYVNESRSFRGMALWYDASATFTDPERPERVSAARVTPNLFDVLGVAPIVGRTFTDEEARDDAAVVVLSHDVWQRRFGSDPGVVGNAVDLDGEARRVLGVLPSGFRLPTDYAEGETTDVYTPGWVDTSGPVEVSRYGGSHSFYAAARLREGVEAEAAQRDLNELIGRLEARGVYPAEWEFGARVVPVPEQVLGTARTALWVLLGAVGLVLLIACGNVANLMGVRARDRRTEMALRSALGASRGRLLRQVLLETLVVALAAGGLGLLLAAGGVELLLSLDPDAVPRAEEVGLDGRVFAFAVLVSAATVGLVGLVPARAAASGDPRASLREAPRSGGRRRGTGRFQGLLVASQLAMAVVLLLGAGLMARTLLNLNRIDPGFRTEGVLTARVTAPTARYPEMASLAGFYDDLLERVRALPGVEEAGAVRSLPLGNQIGDAGITVEGYTPAAGENLRGDWQVVTEGYFEAMAIPVVRGRVFERADGSDADVVVINEAMASRYWPDRDPVGTRMGSFGEPGIVVGVVADVRHNGLTAPVKPKFYRLHRQLSEDWSGAARSMTLTVLGPGGPRSLHPALRRELRSVDPRVALSGVRTIEDVVSGTVARSRFTMSVLGVFSAVALILTVVGIYGVLSRVVRGQRRDIGIRLALGARVGEVVAGIVLRGGGNAAAGVLAGTALAWGLTRLLSGLLYGVEPTDPLTFAAVPLFLLGVALAASWLPARRVAAIDPARSLRAE